jgi:hypothetical protein
MQGREEEVWNWKWLTVRQKTAFKKTVQCTKITNGWNLGQFLYHMKCKFFTWEKWKREISELLVNDIIV